MNKYHLFICFRVYPLIFHFFQYHSFNITIFSFLLCECPCTEHLVQFCLLAIFLSFPRPNNKRNKRHRLSGFINIESDGNLRNQLFALSYSFICQFLPPLHFLLPHTMHHLSWQQRYIFRIFRS